MSFLDSAGNVIEDVTNVVGDGVGWVYHKSAAAVHAAFGEQQSAEYASQQADCDATMFQYDQVLTARDLGFDVHSADYTGNFDVPDASDYQVPDADSGNPSAGDDPATTGDPDAGETDPDPSE